MAAAVDLEEQARLAHPLPAAPVAPRSPGPGRGQARLGEDPAQGPLRDDDPLPLGEQVGEVGPVGSRVRRRGELEEAGAGRLVKAVGRDPAPVAVDERGGRAVRAVGRQEAPDRPDRQPEVGRGLAAVISPVSTWLSTYSRRWARASKVIVSLSMAMRVTKSLAAYR